VLGYFDLNLRIKSGIYYGLGYENKRSLILSIGRPIKKSLKRLFKNFLKVQILCLEIRSVHFQRFSPIADIYKSRSLPIRYDVC